MTPLRLPRETNVYLGDFEQPLLGDSKGGGRIGSERVLFGTDMPTDNPLLEVED